MREMLRGRVLILLCLTTSYGFAACRVEVSATPASPTPTNTAPAVAEQATPLPSPTVSATPTAAPTAAPSPTIQPDVITPENADQLAFAGSLRRHTFPVTKVDWSPDGQWIASAGYDDHVIVWDSAALQPVQRMSFTYQSGPPSFTWAPDSQSLATFIRGTPTLKFYDAPAWEAGRSIELTGDLAWVVDVAFSPDGEWLAAWEDDRVTIWQRSTGAIARYLQKNIRGAQSLLWSPDGAWLATIGHPSGGGSGYLVLWDAITGEMLHDVVTLNAATSRAEVSPDWTLIAFGVRDGTVVLWTPEGRPVRVLNPAPFTVEELAWSPDGSLLAGLADWSADYGRIAVWNVETGELITVLDAPTPDRDTGVRGSDLAWSPDQRTLASVGGWRFEISLWQIQP